MTTWKSEGSTVLRWMVLVIQMLIVLKEVKGDTTSSVSWSGVLSATTSLPISATTSSSAATTTPQLSPSFVGLSASSVTPQSSYFSVGESASASTVTPQSSSSSVGQTAPTATPQSSFSFTPLTLSPVSSFTSSPMPGGATSKARTATASPTSTATTTTTPQLSPSSVGLSASTVTPQSLYFSVGQTAPTATSQSSFSFTPLTLSPVSSFTSSPMPDGATLKATTATASPTSTATTTPQLSPSVGLSASTVTPQSPYFSVGQTAPTATPQSSFSFTPLTLSPVSSFTSSPIPDGATSKATTTTASPTSTTSFPSSVNATVAPRKVPLVYIRMTFSMPWGRFCHLISLFKESLSRNLLEFNGVHYHFVQVQRIKLINAKEKCANRTLYYNKEAILKFYISNREQEFESNATDGKNMTIKAFILLHGFWVNERMILLDKVFENKVTNVELIGADASLYIDIYTEAQRIGIAIGIALAIVVLLLIIIFCVKGYGAMQSFGRRRGDGKMIFKNEHVLEDNTTNESGKTAQPRDEPEDVVVDMHAQPSPPQTPKSEPVTEGQYEMPLLLAIKDYEDGKKVDETKSDEEPHEGEVPLAKPESDNVSEGEPIKPPMSDSIVTEDAITPEEIPAINETLVTYQSVKTNKDTGKPVQPEEEGIGERKPTFTSSVTIVVTPEAGSSPPKFEFESPATEHLPDPEKGDIKRVPAGADGVSGDENAKPDFGQSENSDDNPNQGAINLGFDDNDVAPDDEKEEEEETKF